MIKRSLQIAFFLIGILLFAWVVKAVGWTRLAVIFPALAGWGWAVLCLYPFMCFWDVLAWRTLFNHRWSDKIKFWEFYWIRVAGEAVNNITPFLDIAGEFLKVILLEKRFGISKKASLTAGVMCRSTLIFSEMIFVVSGLSLAVFVSGVPREIRGILVIALSLFAFTVFLLILTQKKGLFVTLIKLLERVGMNPNLFARFHTSLKEVDEEITKFYGTEMRRLALAVSCNLVGWISGGVEVYFMMRILGVEVTLLEGVILESLIQLMRTSSFYIPGNLGVQEGGLAFILGFMGVPSYLGVALSLLKRLRQIIWTAVGFFVWGIFQLLEFKKEESSV